MGRRPLSWRIKLLSRRTYAVLAQVSLGYSPPKGTLPTCYSPVRHSSEEAFDLHVLSPPLAFALSQDQTLQFNPCLCDLRNFLHHKLWQDARSRTLLKSTSADIWFSKTDPAKAAGGFPPEGESASGSSPQEAHGFYRKV